MAVEAGPSMLGGEKLARKKLWLTLGGKPPQKEFLKAAKVKEYPEVLTRDSSSSWDLWVSKEHRAPHSETPLPTVSLWYSSWSGQVWFALPGAHYNMLAGNCRSIYSSSHGRHQPLCHTHKMGDNYAQGYSASLAHPWRASVLLKSSPKSVSVFLLVVGCVGFNRYKGREFSVGFCFSRVCTQFSVYLKLYKKGVHLY